jgi:hypothetical protein
LIGVALALVAFEAALQVGAFWLWRTRQRDAGAGAGGVLCIGDSFTWGMGAHDASGSYPAQLGRRLRAAGRDIAVVNAGWPGRSSRDVALEIVRKLDEHRPRLVYVLAGANDAWQRPARATRAECLAARGAAAAFPVVWRTGRLLLLVRGALAGDAAGAPLGTWHGAEHEFTFEADGRLLADGKELRWVRDGGRLRVLAPNGREAGVRWELRDGELRLESELWSQALSLAPGPRPDPGPLARARALLAGGDAPAAIALLQPCLDDPALRIEAREALVGAHLAAGAPDAAASHVVWLRARWQESQAADIGEALAHALAASGDVAGAVAVAADVFVRDPARVRAVQVLMGPGIAGGLGEQVERAFVRAIDALPRGNARRAELWMTLAILRRANPGESLACIVRASLEGAGDNEVAQFLFTGRDGYTRERFEAILAELPIEERDRARLRALYQSALEGPQRALDVLAGHLELIAALCREHGAQAVLLTYPDDYPGVDGAVQRAARAAGMDWLAVRPAFEAALQSRKREELFVPDGHCTSAGYALIAEVVARDVLGRL